MDIKYLQLAVKWLNGPQDFKDGIEILRNASFRPAVISKLERVGTGGPSAHERLHHNMTMFVRCFKDEELKVDSDAELHIFEGEESPADVSFAKDSKDNIFNASEALPEGSNLKAIANAYANAYKQRMISFRNLKKVGESNDEASKAIRVRCNEEIDSATALMEKLYPYYQKYQETGVEPTAEEVESLLKTESSDEASEETKTTQDDGVNYDAMSKAELTELSYSLVRKITRAKNMIMYQSENAKDEENPLPEGSAKRIKYEVRISRLEPQLEAVRIAIAKK